MAAPVSAPHDVLHCVKRQGVESFSPRLRVVSTSQRSSGQGWEGHQRSNELLSWRGKGISLLQLGFHESFNLFPNWQCCHPLLFLPHQCWYLCDPSVSYSKVICKQKWLGL